MHFYAWLIDLIHRRKNWPTGMISGWVQKVTEHRGTKQYMVNTLHCVFLFLQWSTNVWSFLGRALALDDVELALQWAYAKEIPTDQR